MKKTETRGKTVWLYGIHAVTAALNNPNRKILRFIVSNKTQIAEFPNIKSTKAEIVDKQVFSDIFGKDAIHQCCAVLTERLCNVFLEDILEIDDNRPILLLDQITDPHNVGAILRSAAVFGAKCIVTTEDNAPIESAVLAKSASGALEIVPIVRVINLAQCMKTLKKHNYWCVGLDERGTSNLPELDFSIRYAFVIGSEGNGLRRLTKESCDILVRLPVSSNFSTLNAAQACTVTLYESFKGRI